MTNILFNILVWVASGVIISSGASFAYDWARRQKRLKDSFLREFNNFSQICPIIYSKKDNYIMKNVLLIKKNRSI